MNNICKYLALIINTIFLSICVFINPWFGLIGIIGSFIGMIITILYIVHAIMNSTREDLVAVGQEFIKKYDDLQNKLN